MKMCYAVKNKIKQKRKLTNMLTRSVKKHQKLEIPESEFSPYSDTHHTTPQALSNL